MKTRGALGNRVSAMLAPLPTSVTDPGLRLDIVHSATKVAKAQQAAIPQGLVDQISDFAVPALTARAARVVFATGVLHLWHPEFDRSRLAENERMLDEVVRGDRVRALRGLSAFV